MPSIKLELFRCLSRVYNSTQFSGHIKIATFHEIHFESVQGMCSLNTLVNVFLLLGYLALPVMKILYGIHSLEEH